MPLPDTMFCAQQIDIPPAFPDILKQFTKAAIRTQPHDVLQWSAAYFTALYKGNTLPVKDRLEMPVATQKTDTGLTPGLLKILHKQLSPNIYVNENEVNQKWKELGIPIQNLERILELGNIVPKVDFEWMKFLALACSSLSENLLAAMTYACEILTNDPPGGAAYIEFSIFKYLYSYLAKIEGIPENEIEAVILSLEDDVIRQDGLIQPRNFMQIVK
ncbi:ropporin-1-like protein [Callorhinchus milii]|uniref:Ropporin-1-like protein n=2 Tax=Callorhinchus milii TaxID=7868 RepID=V9L5H3_CALMI|nr:ropporin-1-like protein [Callorhinchus milii]|eukprot:gi/632945117/ref/XP_007887877.1/ PREDICTED: ropporin-1-like protein [Callorhinchus milii]